MSCSGRARGCGSSLWQWVSGPVPVGGWAAAPGAAWPTRGSQRHPWLLGQLWALKARADGVLSRGSCPGTALPASLPLPAPPHPVFLTVSAKAVAALRGPVAGGPLLQLQCSVLVTGSVAPWSELWRCMLYHLHQVRATASLCRVHHGGRMEGTVDGGGGGHSSASTSCGP